MTQTGFKVENSWFTGACKLNTYQPEELLGTKLRALNQRRKGRYLFDLYWAYQHHSINTGQLLHCYREYMSFDVEHPPAQKIFIANMEEKMKDREFTGDINVVLRPGLEYNNAEAYEFVRRVVLEHI